MVKENRIVTATRYGVLLTALLHSAAHGEVPEKIRAVMSGLSIDFEKEVLNFKNEVPHKYELIFLSRVLAEKTLDASAFPSMVIQALSLLHPQMTKYLIWHLVYRRRRMTY